MTSGSEAAAALGAAIKKRRLQLSMSASEASRLAGVDLTHYQRIERGASNPTLHVLLRIAHTLETPLAGLMGGLDVLALPESDPLAFTRAEFRTVTRRTQENSTDE